LGFFSNKKKETDELQIDQAKSEVKKKSDKKIKSTAPKGLVGKKIVRTFFWVFMSLLILKGAIAFAQGNRTINQTIVNGVTTTDVSDSVKGFAADFATEYFTWKPNLPSERISRLQKFIKGVDGEMGVKNFDVKGSSKVTSAEVYTTNQIDATHVDVTIVVWRDVSLLPDQIEAAQGTSTPPPILQKKAYMVVPITLAEEGPVIQSYPRFVSEQQRGDTVDSSTVGVSIGDGDIFSKGKDLADSFLKSWYEGNASQLRYFYADTAKSPDSLQKSEFTYDKLDKVSVYQNPAKAGESTTYRIEANVIVRSDLGEPFTNSWILQVSKTDDRLYVISNGIKQSNVITSPIPDATESPAPTSAVPISE
jgi:hypothetical protein